MTSASRGEVSTEILASNPRMADLLGVSLEKFYGPLGPELAALTDRIPWGLYVAMKARTAELAGSDDRLIELGGAIMDTPETAQRGLGLFVTPVRFMHMASKRGWGRFYDNLDVETHIDGDTITVELTLHPGYAPCRPFFVQNVGILTHAPRLVGCDLAKVEWETDGYRARYVARAPASRTIWAQIKRRVIAIFNSGGTFAELEAQQRKLDEKNNALRVALHEAREALATRDRFLQTIDHELRTPLNGIRGGVDALLDLDLGEDGRAWTELLAKSESRLSDVIRAMLEYTRLDSEKLVPRARDFRPTWLAMALTREVLRKTPEARVEIAEGTPSAWLRADDERIQRVVQELLDNAVEHGGGGTVELSITHVAEHLRIAVTDQGPGIGLLDQKRIFEPFAQLSTRDARDRGGSGLGLSIAASIARALGGAVDVDSAPGEGTRFVATFPVEASRRVERAERHSLPAVLLVDDDRINRMVGRRLLERLGCEVVVAEDGLEALAKYDEDTLDLVLMDCEMPELDGWSATKKLREERNASTPVVAVTAYTSEEDRRRCYEAGMDDFVPKPLSQAVLSAVLERWT